MNKNIKSIPYTFIKGEDSSKNIVFIHGSGCNKKFLEPIAKKIKKYDCYLIDLPGHGESTDTNYSLDNYIDSIVEFVKELDNVVLVGHSLGGTLVLAVAARQVKSVEKIVVLNGGAKYDVDKTFMEKIREGIVDLEALMSVSGSLDNPEVISALATFDPPEVIVKDFIIGDELDINEDLKNIKVPTLIMTGGDEILVPVSVAHNIVDRVKETELIIVPNTMHMMPVAESDLVATTINRFAVQ